MPIPLSATRAATAASYDATCWRSLAGPLAEPNSPSKQALNLLAIRTSTQDPLMAVDDHEEFSAQRHRTEL
jgi:hypothetical protein